MAVQVLQAMAVTHQVQQTVLVVLAAAVAVVLAVTAAQEFFIFSTRMETL